MAQPYQVLIAYRPFVGLNPALAETVASDTTIQLVAEALKTAGFETDILRVGDDIRAVLGAYDPCQTVIFNYCDGFADDPNGYDPVTQLWEELGFAFTGSSDEVIRFTFDKAKTKAVLQAHGIPTPVYAVCETQAPTNWTHFPAIVKPALLHGSFGLSENSVVETPAQLHHQVEYVIETFKQAALVEDFIDGEEYRVDILGSDTLEVLPLMEIDYSARSTPRERFKTFDVKWEPETHYPIQYTIPAPIDQQLKTHIEMAVKAAYRALNLRDYGGSDVRVRDNQPYLLETNPNPDISEVSTFLRMAKTAGYDYSTMLAKIVRLAAQRIPARVGQTAGASNK